MKILVLAVIFLAGCSGGPPSPVEIEAADVCTLCKMAISQKEYCAELIDRERRVFKFDDIGCMLRFARDQGLTGADARNTYVFVRDYNTRDWLKGGSAQFVRSTRIPSPMASGLLAVSGRKKAEQYAQRFGGQVLGFVDLWKSDGR